MAPELFTGTQADESSDIFALGVTIYRMFTGGAYPYGEVEAFAQPRLGRATALAKLRPDLPAWLDRALLRAIAIDPPRALRRRHRVRVRARARIAARRAACDRAASRSTSAIPMRFWQVVSALLFIALLIALY